MNIKPDCINCILNQTLKVCKLLELDEYKSKELLDSTNKILIDSSMDMTPPQIAKDTYAQIARLTDTYDPVAKAKEIATNMALKVDTSFIKTIDDAIKISAIGNVIDFGAQNQLDLNQTIKSHFNKEFALDSTEMFKEELKTTKTLVYIGDNCAEHIFDKLLIQKIKELYDIDIYYFVRGKPIINDVTIKEASYLEDVATIVDTGVPTPSYELAFANDESKELFKSADLVIAKGMGNYESLYDEVDREIYYLFIVKCSVVSEDIGKDIGEFIFTKH